MATNLSDFGGGSVLSTPSDPPYGKGAISGGACFPSLNTKFEHRDCQTDFTPNYCLSFSPKTCYELLPTLSTEQINFEAQYFKMYNSNFSLRDTRHPTLSAKTTAIQTDFSKNILTDFERVLNKYNKLTTDISYLLGVAAEHLDDMKTITSLTQSADPLISGTEHVSSPDGKLSEPVCVLNLKLLDLNVNQILGEMDVGESASCNRKVAYYGNLPYSYGRGITHSPQNYPECETFKYIFDKLSAVDSEFTPENYTCLVTLYPDGRSFIPPHSDNEDCIEKNSLIYTISVGAKRVIRFTNQIGNLNEQECTLDHGSVFTMTAESQHEWHHSIERDLSVHEPRVSFTFRRLRADYTPPAKPIVPPIAPPKPPGLPQSAAPVNGTHNRILFLTDSVLSGSTTYLFNKVEGHKCIKKYNYKLQDVFNFESEFTYSNYVIFSCGVNDLSRYGCNAHTLADFVYKRLVNTCRKNPNTIFIFNSLLLTTFSWLNREIVKFNRIMFNLSLKLENLYYFDSHHVVRSSVLRSVVAENGNGVHVTAEARSLIMDRLVRGVIHLQTLRSGSCENSQLHGDWPLGPSFIRMLQSPRY